MIVWTFWINDSCSGAVDRRTGAGSEHQDPLLVQLARFTFHLSMHFACCLLSLIQETRNIFRSPMRTGLPVALPTCEPAANQFCKLTT